LEANKITLQSVLQQGYQVYEFASVRDTLLELLGDPQYLGATPGIMATLHT
jgi:hypothetical protein